MDIEAHLRDLRARQRAVRPDGSPSQVEYPLGEISIPAHAAHWAQQRPDRAAIVFEGREISYVELADLSDRVAGWLRSAGVRPGDRVAVFLPNTPQFIVTMLAVLRIGAVHVPVNPMFHSTELAHELNDSGAEFIVTFDSLLPTVDEVWQQSAVRRVLVTGAAEMAAAATEPAVPDGPDGAVTAWSVATAHAAVEEPVEDLDALAALNYTGGTTGLPKGCEHTQRHMLYTAASSLGAIHYTTDRDLVALCYVPIFWIAGEDIGILNPIVLGGTVVLLPRWDPEKVLEAISTYGVTTVIGTVENYLELLEHPDFASHDFDTLTDPMAVSFVRKLDPEVRHRWQQAVGEHSMLREGSYGMTETHTCDTSPYGLHSGDQDLNAEPVFCGLPVPGTDIVVVSYETAEPVPVGEAGEIIVRSPSVMTRYWRNDQATREQLRNGWLHTGDNGRMDENGCLHYLGRQKDMIKVNGMSVFPAEVEMLLARHPAVRTAAVVPAADAEKGQLPVAFVSLEPDASAGEAELGEWAAQHMASYKVPRVHIVTEFPMTATGKIRKGELSERVQQQADSVAPAKGGVR